MLRDAMPSVGTGEQASGVQVQSIQSGSPRGRGRGRMLLEGRGGVRRDAFGHESDGRLMQLVSPS